MPSLSVRVGLLGATWWASSTTRMSKANRVACRVALGVDVARAGAAARWPGQPRHRHDDAREQRERVGVQAVRAADVLHRLGVDDLEVEAELLAHLVLPLQAEPAGQTMITVRARWRRKQLLDDQARPRSSCRGPTSSASSRLARGVAQRPAERLELVGLDVGAAAERRLDGLVVGAGDRTPPERVDEGGELGRGRRTWSGRSRSADRVRRLRLRPGSSSQTTRSSWPRRSSSTDWSVTACWSCCTASSCALRGRLCCWTSVTAQLAPRTLTICPTSGTWVCLLPVRSAEGIALTRAPLWFGSKTPRRRAYRQPRRRPGALAIGVTRIAAQARCARVASTTHLSALGHPARHRPAEDHRDGSCIRKSGPRPARTPPDRVIDDGARPRGLANRDAA